MKLFATAALLALTTTVASAQPADKSKTDAKALMTSGVKLFNAKDYLGALVVFEDAYTRFQSAKILLNIATTLVKLERPADAANAYQRYLDSSDADPTKQAEVTRVLAELDKKVGSVALTVTPADAELRLGDAATWIPASSAKRLRVPAAGIVIHAKRVGHVAADHDARAPKGTTVELAITLAPEPVVTAPDPKDPPGDDVSDIRSDDRDLPATSNPGPFGRSRIGLLAIAHVDPIHPGAAGLVGLTADVTSRLAVQATALLGATSGGYAGVTFAFRTGNLRPFAAAGLPVFISNGARFGARGAVGLELALDKHFSIVAEVGVERMLNPEDNIAELLFVPALGATARL